MKPLLTLALAAALAAIAAAWLLAGGSGSEPSLRGARPESVVGEPSTGLEGSPEGGQAGREPAAPAGSAEPDAGGGPRDGDDAARTSDVTVRAAGVSTQRPLTNAAGHRIEIRDGGGRGPVLGTGVLGADGRVTIAVPEARLRRHLEGDPGLIAAVVGPGFEHYAGWVRAYEHEGVLSGGAEVRVRSARNLVVRLVDEAGEPLETERGQVLAWAKVERRAEVAPVEESGRVGTPVSHAGLFSYDVRVRAVPLPDGAYAVSCQERMPLERIQFDVEGHGSGGLAVDLAMLDRPDAVFDIVLRGTGSIRGVVVDGAGDPVAGQHVVATWSRDARPVPYGSGEWDSAPPADEWSAGAVSGRTFAYARTDADGRFAFDGLALREFFVFVPRVEMNPYASVWREVATVEAAIEPEELEIVDPLAGVECVAFGAEGDDFAFDVYEGERRGDDVIAPYGWYGARAPAAMAVRSEQVRVGASGRASVRIRLPRGHDYLVVATSGGRQSAPVAVHVGEASTAFERVEFRADDLQTSGSIEVSVQDADRPGTEVPAHHFAVWIEDLRTGMVLASRDSRALSRDEEGPLRLPAPARRVRVVAEGTAFLDFHHGVVIAERSFGRAEAIVEVTAGETRAVDLVLPRGGALEVDLRGRLGEADERALRAESERMRGSLRDEDEVEFLGARLRLLRADGGPAIPVSRIGMAMEGTTSAGHHVLQHWPLGEVHTSEMLPAGTYTLEATQVTRDPVRTQVTITPGETTRIVLDVGTD